MLLSSTNAFLVQLASSRGATLGRVDEHTDRDRLPWCLPDVLDAAAVTPRSRSPTARMIAIPGSVTGPASGARRLGGSSGARGQILHPEAVVIVAPLAAREHDPGDLLDGQVGVPVGRVRGTPAHHQQRPFRPTSSLNWAS